ncbi:hypothetical protein HDU76_005450 [Blyttiomyces sp. JEL0837]|nr:hypothetical protein HDU76_005450 [Blyttiomyces sp. JEL0837]
MGAVLSARFSDVYKEGRPAQYYYVKAKEAALEAMDSPCLNDIQALISLYEFTVFVFSFTNYERVLSPQSSNPPILQAKANVKPLCDDDIWESLADPSQLHHLFYKDQQQPKSTSITYALNRFIVLSRKVLGAVKGGSVELVESGEEQDSIDIIDDKVISGFESVLDDAYADIPGAGRFPLDVKHFTRGATSYLMESQSILAREFQEWVFGYLNRRGVGESQDLPWANLVMERDRNQQNEGSGLSGKPNAPLPSTTSPSDWYFEMWNRDLGAPWRTVSLQFSYHYQYIILHNRRLFYLVKMLSATVAETGESNDTGGDIPVSTTTSTPTPTCIDFNTMNLLNRSFQLCRASAEHICVFFLSILEGGSSTGVKTMFVGSRFQTVYQAALILVMLISAGSKRYIRYCLDSDTYQGSGNNYGIWDSEVDEEAVKTYLGWLDTIVDVLGVTMAADAHIGLMVKDLARVVKKLKRGEAVKEVLNWSGKGEASPMSSDETEADEGTGSSLSDRSKGKATVSSVDDDDNDPVAELADDFKESLLLEKIRDVRKFTNILAEVVDKSTAASIRSGSVAGTSSRETSMEVTSSGAGSSRAGSEEVQGRSGRGGRGGDGNFVGVNIETTLTRVVESVGYDKNSNSMQVVTSANISYGNLVTEVDADRMMTVEEILDIESIDWGGPQQRQ